MSLDPETVASFSSEIESLAKKSIIAKLPFNPQDREPSELKDFFTKPDNQQCNNVNTSKRSANLNAILDILKSEGFPGAGIKRLKDWANFIIFLGEQYDERNEWSSPENAVLVSEIIKEVRTCFLNKHTDDKHGCQLEGLFMEDLEDALTLKKTIFAQILRIQKTNLKPDEWKYYPATATSFFWILKQIKYPYLSEFVDDVLPPSLLMTDDYTRFFKLLGLDCIAHCIKNVNKAELRRNNWGMVIYDALLKLIHESDTEIIDKLAPTLLNVLDQIEDNPNENSNQLTKYDDTMKKILFTMEFSSDLKQKKIWIPHLISFIKTMGHATLHWVDRISSMLLDYTTCNDQQLWIEILKCVAACIQNTWLKPNSNTFAEIILRIVFNYSVFTDKKMETETPQRGQIHESISYCLELLSSCEDFGATKVQLQEILKSSESKQLNPLFIYELNKYDI